MRILHLGKYYAPARGGMETVLRLLCEGLLDGGVEVTALVAATARGDRHEEIVGPTSGRTGRLVRAGRLGVVNSQPITPTLPALLHREIRDFRPDLVQVHLPNPLAALAWLGQTSWSRRGAPPLVVWYHADITRQRLGKHLVGPVVRRCLDRSRGICVSSLALADRSPALAPWREKVTTIPFGIDPGRWAAVQSDHSGPFLFLGRLVPYKGLALLCEAVGGLPAVRLLVVGEGPEQPHLERLIQRRGWAERIHLCGALSHAELIGRMQTARALVLPSLDQSEAFGMVQLEALAAGLPVIASKLPTGAGTIVNDGSTGRLIAPGDLHSLRAALEELQADPELAASWGQAGRAWVRDRFTATAMVARLIRWYDELIGG